jgi:nucleoside-diphosphate-sugar epimerase
MTDTIAILGATGVLGRHLIPRLTAAGYRVRALVRRPEAADVARACDADIRVADIFDLGSLRTGVDGCDIAINLATTLPGPSGRGDFAENDRLRREGTPIWVEACREAAVPRVLQQSIAMVNAAGDELADEETERADVREPTAAAAISAAIAMEESVRASDLDWIVLRGGLYYGPGTGFDDDWLARAAAGKLRMPGDGQDFVSLIHMADMATAALATVQVWPSRQTLIVADDSPARWRDVFGYIATMTGAPEPTAGGRAGFPSFRVSNAKARRLLGWSPIYGDFRAGLAR